MKELVGKLNDRLFDDHWGNNHYNDAFISFSYGTDNYSEWILYGDNIILHDYNMADICECDHDHNCGCGSQKKLLEELAKKLKAMQKNINWAIDTTDSIASESVE